MMPQIEKWSGLPAAIRDHLVERMHEREIGLDDLNQLRLWIESRPDVPEGLWYKDFGSFKLCGQGSYPKTFLTTQSSSARTETLVSLHDASSRSAALLPAGREPALFAEALSAVEGEFAGTGT
jgi:hypothetical protein